MIQVREDWMADPIYSVPIHASLGKEIPDSIGETAINDGKTVLDESDVFASVCGIDKHSSEAWIVNIYLENNSNRELYLDTNNIAVNGASIRIANSGVSVPPE